MRSVPLCSINKALQAEKVKLKLSQYTNNQLLFAGLALSIVVGVVSGIATDSYFLFGLPAIFLGAFITIVDFRKIFYLLLFCLPLSTEIELPGGFGTDFPSELLTVLLAGIFLLFVIQKGRQLNSAFVRHPLTLLLLLHFGWILITTLNSDQLIISLKFLLAKSWYVITFYFLAGYLLKTEAQIKLFFWCVFSALLFTVFVILIRHAATGFSFEEVNFVLKPFYRNHVSYAAILVLFFPYLWYATTWYPRWSWKWWSLVICVFIFLIAVYLTYTRAAYVSLILAAGVYFVIRFRLMKVAIGLAIIAGLAGVIYVSTDNKYLDYAPDFNKAISHKKFDNLIEATAKGEDISTMERVYRWVAGFHMVSDQPWMGFGPGNFYDFYVPYTVNSFSTYVSDNPEHSGVHSYFLMVAIEQGILGLIIFLLLCFYTLLLGERLYHQTRDVSYRRIVLMAILSIVAIDVILLINDMVETDKVGSFFFIAMAVLVNVDLRGTERRGAERD